MQDANEPCPLKNDARDKRSVPSAFASLSLADELLPLESTALVKLL